MYIIRYTEDAKNDLLRLQRNEPKAFAKMSRFIQELAEHPKTGTGHPEPLKGLPQGRWSVKSPRSTDWFTVSSTTKL